MEILTDQHRRDHKKRKLYSKFALVFMIDSLFSDREQIVAITNSLNDLYNPPKPPPSLCHYTNLNALEGITRSHTIRATYNRALNDPTEQIHAEVVISEALRALAESKLQLRVDITQAIRRPRHYIASFCESGSLPKMWSRYGGGGSGCCIEFDYRGLRSTFLPQPPANMSWPLLSKVNYGPVPPCVERHLRALCNGFQSHGSNVASSAAHLWLFIAGFIKDREWEEEREWRIVAVDPPDERVQFPPRENPILRPYIELSWLHWGRPKGRLPITRVTYLPEFDPHGSTANQARSILVKNGYHAVPVEPCFSGTRLTMHA